MEPCLFRHGKVDLEPRCIEVGRASMEPCLFRHGKEPVELQAPAHLAVASMEPCLFRHGKVLAETGKHRLRGGFNGAMSFQTW